MEFWDSLADLLSKHEMFDQVFSVTSLDSINIPDPFFAQQFLEQEFI
jgi:hypothetical protein